MVCGGDGQVGLNGAPPIMSSGFQLMKPTIQKINFDRGLTNETLSTNERYNKLQIKFH